MKTMKLLPLLLLLASPTVVQSQFTFTTNNGAVTITGYYGSGVPVTIPSTTNGWPVTTIGTNAFDFNNMPNVIIPNSVTNLESGAFSDCYMLTNVIIPSSVISIGDNAFFGCLDLTNAIIPSSVTSIGIAPFSDCQRMNAIRVDINNPVYTVVSGVLFNTNQTTLIEHPGGKTGSYTIPSSVTIIGSQAFSYSIYVNSINIPSSVTNIGDYAFDSVYLTTITVDVANPSYSGVAGVLFNQNRTTLIQYLSGKHSQRLHNHQWRHHYREWGVRK